ncbi:MAG TPA: extracellular solute-binding protein [Limnochordia bacterium]
MRRRLFGRKRPIGHSFHRALRAAAAIAFGPVLLAACAAPPAAAEVERIVYANWEYGPAQQEMHRALVAEFNKAYAARGWQVEYRTTEYDKIIVEIAAGTSPDVVNSYREPELGPQGALLDLAPFLKREASLFGDALTPVVFDYYHLGDSVWAMPQAISVEDFVYYNLDLFDQAGLAYPDGQWTWETFLDAARKLTIDSNGDGIPEQYGTTSQWLRQRSGWVYAAGAAEWALDGSGPQYSDPAVLEAIQFVIDLERVHGVVPPPGSPVLSNMLSGLPFSTGKVAMNPGAVWEASVYSAVDGLRWDVGPPLIKERRGIRVVAFPLDVVATTKHPEVAWEFVKFAAMSPQANALVLRYHYGIPVRRDTALRLEGPLRKMAEYAMQWAWVDKPWPGRNEVDGQLIRSQLSEVLAGTKGLAAAAEEIMRLAPGILAKYPSVHRSLPAGSPARGR